MRQRRKRKQQQNDAVRSSNRAMTLSWMVGASWCNTLVLRWKALSHFNRHWLQNIAIGIAIEVFIHLAGHTFHFAPIVNFQNWGLDTMMRLNALACTGLESSARTQPSSLQLIIGCPQAEPLRLAPVLIAIDAETWRQPEWGGGEPYRAPRTEIANLIDQSFQSGARQVVVDIAIEERAATSNSGHISESRSKLDHQEDEEFAARLASLMKMNYFQTGKKLILVRTIREPYQNGIDNVAFLGELRKSSAIDSLIEKSDGRIAIAAPYFRTGSDGITRNWDLVKQVCSPPVSTESIHNGVIKIVPSVQLVTIAHQYDIQSSVVSPAGEAGSRCTVAPFLAPSDLSVEKAELLACQISVQILGPSNARMSHACKAAKDQCNVFDPNLQFIADICNREKCESGSNVCHNINSLSGLNARYWSKLQTEFSEKSMLTDLPNGTDIGNRIVFRYPPEQLETVNAGRLLHDHDYRQMVSPRLADRIVVIGQTYTDSGDHFDTPLGRMPGAAVLVNAIDSMQKHRLIRSPSALVTVPLAFGLIVLVGYLFAKFNSAWGTWISTIVVICSVGLLSFVLFADGVWLDFVAPILGIRLHRSWAAFEERHALKLLAAKQGVHH